MTAPFLIAAEGLEKQFPGVKAVDGISLGVRPGQCFGLLGPNGAGKTTTLEMLEGIQAPSAGRVLFRGRALDAGFREQVGIQFQATALQDFQRVREALAMFAGLYRHHADLDALIALCHLGEILERDTRKLSGGQRQRLLLAIALVNDPVLVFLDEPTTGLDPQARRNFWALIDRVRERGTSILLTTHYMEEAERLCDEIAIVDQGRILTQGQPQALIRTQFPAAILRLPAGAWPTHAQLPAHAVRRDTIIELLVDDIPPALAQLEHQGVSLAELRIDRPTLEDLFLKLTGHHLRA
jgi:ABC-2 type transport system ATP-binding protein